MRSFCLAALGVSVAGCVWEAPARRGATEYRSQEAYGTAHWGMNEDELRRAVADLSACGAMRLCREEELEGRPARVTYELLHGRLGQIRLAVSSAAPYSDFQRLGRDLVSAYGKPVESRGLDTSSPSPSPTAWSKPWTASSVVNLVVRAGPSPSLVAEWVTPETELWLIAVPAPRAWLQLTLTSRALGRRGD